MGRALSCTRTVVLPKGAENTPVPALRATVLSISVVAVVAAEKGPGA